MTTSADGAPTGSGPHRRRRLRRAITILLTVAVGAAGAPFAAPSPALAGPAPVAPVVGPLETGLPRPGGVISVDGVVAPHTAAAPDAAAGFTAAGISAAGVPLDAPVRLRGGRLGPIGDDVWPHTPNGNWAMFDGHVVDLTGNGILDYVAVATTQTEPRGTHLVTLFGQGDGTWSAPSFFRLDGVSNGSNTAMPLVVADVTGDGIPDAVVSGHIPANELRVYEGTGTGGWDPDFTAIALPAPPRQTVVADLDGGGDVDILTVHAGSTGRLSIVQNLGATWAPAETVNVGAEPISLAVGDLDGEHGLDVVVGLRGQTAATRVLLDHPDGWVDSPISITDPPQSTTAAAASHLWIADFDGDGTNDLAMVGRTCPTALGSHRCLTTYTGNGDGTFTAAPVVDEDGDGLDDLGRYHRVTPANPTNPNPYVPAPAPPLDHDGDGHLDLLWSIGPGDRGHVLLARGQAGGGFAVDALIAGGGAPADAVVAPNLQGDSGHDARGVHGVQWGDVDGDGGLDIVATLTSEPRARNGGMVVLPSDLTSPVGFDAAFTVPIAGTPDLASSTGIFGSYPRNAALGDWTGDGIPDLVFRTGSTSSYRLGVVPGLGDGAFGPLQVLDDDIRDTPTCARTTTPREVRLIDVDGDGHLDVIYDAFGSSGLCVIHGDGAGGIKPVDVDPDPDVEVLRNGVSVPVPGGTGSSSWANAGVLAYGDIDGDGDVDAVALHYTGTSEPSVLRTFRNGGTAGDWTVEDLHTHERDTNARVALGDVDGDGRLDLLVARPRPQQADGWLDVHLGDGTGSFAETPITTAHPMSSNQVTDVNLVDLDGDGRDDLVVSVGVILNGEGRTEVLLAQPDGSFALAATHVGTSHGKTEVVDLDGDGHLDIVHASLGFGVEVLRGTGGDLQAGEAFEGPYRFSTGGARTYLLLLDDLDGDGRLDVVAHHGSGPELPSGDLTVLLQVDPLDGTPGGGDVADLAVSDVTAPASVEAGTDATVSWTVTNVGDGAAGGSWVDSVWLSLDDTWDPTDVLLGEVPRAGPVGPGADYTGELTAPVLPIVHGDHHVIVRANARRSVAEASFADNAAPSAPADVTIPEIVAGTPGTPLEVDLAPGEVRYARVAVAEGEPLRLTLSGPADAADVEVSRNAVPGRTRDHVMPRPVDASRTLDVAGGAAGELLLKVTGRAGLGSGDTITLAAGPVGFGVFGVSPAVIGNRGEVTVTVTGHQLDADATVRIVGDGVDVAATEVRGAPDGSRLFATFILGDGDGASPVPAGDHDLAVDQGTDSAVLGDALRVIDTPDPGRPPTRTTPRGEVPDPCAIPTLGTGNQCRPFKVQVHAPSDLRPMAIGGPGIRATITWQNTALVDIPRPYLSLDGEGLEMIGPGQETFRAERFDLPLELNGARADVLPAGASGQIVVRYRPVAQGPFRLSVGIQEPFGYQIQDYSQARNRFAQGAPSPALVGAYDDALDVRLTPMSDCGGMGDYVAPGGFAPASKGQVRTCAFWTIRGTTSHDYVAALGEVALEAQAHGVEMPSESERLAAVYQKIFATTPGAPIQGTIERADAPGTPVPEPDVVLVDAATGEPQLAYAWFDGSFAAWEPGSGAHEVLVEGHHPHVAATITPDDGPATVEVTPGSTLRGTVTDELDQPVEGLELNATDEDGWTATTFTAADGSYELIGLHDGDVTLATGGDRLATVVEVAVAGDTVHDLVAPAGAAVHGVVRAGPGGPGVAGVPVVLEPADATRGEVKVVETGEDGAFVLGGLLDGDHSVTVDAPGYGIARTAVELVTGSLTEVDVDLAPASTLQGTAIDASAGGAPIAGANVEVLVGDDPRPFTATTAADGTFQVPDLPAGEARVGIGRPGESPRFFALTIPAGSTLSEVYELLPFRDLTGRIVDQDGQPLGLVGVVALDPHGTLPAGPEEGGSAEDGTFTIPSVEVGEVTLRIGGAVDQVVAVGPDGVVGDVVVPVARIAGTVAGGVPTEGLVVALVGDGQVLDVTPVDAAGAYELLVLADGSYEVHASGQGVGFARTTLTVADGAGTVAPLTFGSGSIEVSLTGEVDEAAVAVHSADVAGDALTLVGYLDPDAPSATFAGLADGTYLVEVGVPDRAPVLEAVTVAGGTESVVADLAPLTRLSGSITSDGAPVPYGQLFAVDDSGEPFFGLGAVDGGYEWELPAGTYTIFATDEAGAALRLADVVVTGAEQTLDLPLLEAGTITASVPPQPLGLTGAVLAVDATTGGVVAATTPDGTGTVTLAGLPAGTYRLHLRQDGRPTVVTDEVTVAAGAVVAAGPIAPASASVLLRQHGFGDIPQYGDIDFAGFGPAGFGPGEAGRGGFGPGNLFGIASVAERVGDLLAAGDEPTFGIAASPFGGLFGRAIDWLRSSFDYVVQTWMMGIEEPNRSAEEETNQRIRDKIQAELDNLTRRQQFPCRTVVTNLDIAIKHDQSREAKFQVWKASYDGLADYFAVATLELLKVMGGLAAFVVGVLGAVKVLAAGTAYASASAAATSLLNTAAFGSTVGNLMGFIGLSGALAEGFYALAQNLITRLETATVDEIIADFQGAVASVIDSFLVKLGEPFGLAALNLGTLGTLSGAISESLETELKAVTDLVEAAEDVDADLASFRGARADMQRELLRVEHERKALLSGIDRAAESGRLADYDQLMTRLAEFDAADPTDRLRAQIPEVEDMIIRAQGKSFGLRERLRDFGGLQKARAWGSKLFAALGPVGDLLQMPGNVSDLWGSLGQAADQLKGRGDKLEQARLDYLRAALNTQVQLQKTASSIRNRKCDDQVTPDQVERRLDTIGLTALPADPNEIVGPGGVEAARYLADVPEAMAYTIHFENLGPGSLVIPPGMEPTTIAAAVVIVDTVLDDDVDLASFELGEMGWGGPGGVVVTPPSGLQSYTERTGPYDATDLGLDPFFVDVTGSLDHETRTVRWVLSAIDPETGYPPGDARGLLPPEDGEGIGQGYVTYTVDAAPDAPSGTVIEAQASIVFDTNDAIVTNTWSNTLDGDDPVAEFGPVASSVPSDVPLVLDWDVSDPTSAVTEVDLWVQRDDVWEVLAAGIELVDEEGEAVDGIELSREVLAYLAGVEDPSEDGPVPASTQRFALTATDLVGHTLPAPTDPQLELTIRASSGVVDPPPPPPPPPLGCLAPAAGRSFADVPAGSFYAPAVAWAQTRGVTTGVGGTNRFEPARAVTRAEAVTMIWRAEGCPTGHGPHGFVDVPSGTWYELALRWAKATGVTTGVGGTNRFEPARAVTRAEGLTMLWRAEGRPGGPWHGFVDVPAGSWFDRAARWAKSAGVTTGVGGTNRFDPHRSVLRSEHVTFLWRTHR